MLELRYDWEHRTQEGSNHTYVVPGNPIESRGWQEGWWLLCNKSVVVCIGNPKWISFTETKQLRRKENLGWEKSSTQETLPLDVVLISRPSMVSYKNPWCRHPPSPSFVLHVSLFNSTQRPGCFWRWLVEWPDPPRSLNRTEPLFSWLETRGPPSDLLPVGPSFKLECNPTQ